METLLCFDQQKRLTSICAMRVGGHLLSATLIKALTSGRRIAMGGHPMSILIDAGHSMHMINFTVK